LTTVGEEKNSSNYKVDKIGDEQLNIIANTIYRSELRKTVGDYCTDDNKLVINDRIELELIHEPLDFKFRHSSFTAHYYFLTLGERKYRITYNSLRSIYEVHKVNKSTGSLKQYTGFSDDFIGRILHAQRQSNT